MNRLCSSAVLLILLGSMLGSIPGGDSNQVQSKSQLISSLQTGGKGGESMEEAGKWLWWMLPTLFGFLLESERLDSRNIS